MLIFLWFLFAVGVAVIATRRRRNGIRWFLFSVLISPLLGLIFLLLFNDLSKDYTERIACPKCSESVLITANICHYCKSDLQSNNLFQNAIKEIANKLSEDRKNLMIGILLIICLILVAKIIDSI
jgi:hypothetical protein